MAEKQHRKYPCPHCSRIFGKAEHLSRHERAHTGSKPFRCSVCKQSFSRQDSLARHQKRHGPEHHVLEVSHLGGRVANPELDFDTNATPQHLNHDTTTEDSIGADFQLHWPDSEDLLQSILSADLDTWPVLGAPDLPALDGHGRVGEPDSPWIQPSTGQDSSCPGNDAVLNLSRLITSASADIAIEAQSTGLTTTFLDDSLLMFWSKFVPTFPVVHEPTFVFRDWTYPLLLNAIALGSLFTGREEDKIKGEILWRLAHTSVATSWHSLIKHKGPYDSCYGIQLVLTALLGQTYAILSKNSSIRMTAAIFHSLGFFWAQETGMYDFENHGKSFPSQGDRETLSDLERWRSWAARETQLRALLGHYILDGYISQYTGGPTCRKHTTSTLHLPTSNKIFTASSCEQWLTLMKMDEPCHHPLWKVFSMTFSAHIPTKHLGTFYSAFGASVALEGIKSLIADAYVGPMAVVGIPSRREITYALSRFYAQMKSSGDLTMVEKTQIELRWHAAVIDIAIDFNGFYHNLCHNYLIVQTIFRGRCQNSKFNLNTWASSVAGRWSLLSALAIHDTLSNLPLGITPHPHLAASIFMAAVVYSAMLLSGVKTVSVPRNPEYESIIMSHDDSGQLLDTASEHEYLCFSRGAEVLQGIVKNLRYDINLFSMALKNIADIWGVSKDMHDVLQELLSAVNSVETRIVDP